MSCWNGHMPHMTDDQVHQAVHAYMQEFDRQWQHAWQSPLNPLRDVPQEPPDKRKPPRQTTSLPPARQGDKEGAIDVEYVRVR